MGKKVYFTREEKMADQIAALTARLAERDAQIAALREALEDIYNVADSIWVDNVTGAADASDPTPMKAEHIIKCCKDALAAVPAPPTATTDKGGGRWIEKDVWQIKEPPSDAAMVERIRALQYAIPFTLSGDPKQVDRLLLEVMQGYRHTYGTVPNEEQVRRACGFPPTAAPPTAAERDALIAQVAALEAIQDEAEAELVRFTDALMTIKRRIADAFAGDNLHSEARALVGYIKDVLALGTDAQAALRAARGEASDAQ